MSAKEFNKGSVSLTITLDDEFIKKHKLRLIENLWKTGEALHTDLVQSQTMPRDTGHMQNEATFVIKQAGKPWVAIDTATDYARRLYYHPEYHFSKEANPNAQAYWLETYISGDKKDFAFETFKKFCEQG